MKFKEQVEKIHFLMLIAFWKKKTKTLSFRALQVFLGNSYNKNIQYKEHTLSIK